MSKKERSNKNVRILTKHDDVAPWSEQSKEKVITGQILPDVPFYLLINTVDSSFVVGGVIDKLSTRADSGFEDFSEDDVAKFPAEQVAHLRYILDNMDVQYAMTNIAVCGNYWLEITWGKDSQKPRDIELIPFLTSECFFKDNWTLVQRNGHGDKEFEKGRYIQLKRRSLKTRYYGDSIFSKCVRQIVTLDAIDTHYSNFFANGLIDTKLLLDKEGALDPKDILIIQETIRDRMRGQDNSFSTAIIPTDMGVLDLSSEVDIKGLVEYRRDLIKSIAIALNVPYDLLSSENSNRSTSEVSQEDFNSNVVAPLQEHFVRQLRIALKPYFGDLVNAINLYPIDTKNQKEEMEIHTGYRNAGIMTTNMILAQLGMDPVEGGDTLEVMTKKPDVATMSPEEINNVNKIKKALATWYNSLLEWQR